MEKQKGQKSVQVCFIETWNVKKYKPFKLIVRVKLHMKVLLIVKVLVAHIFQAWPTFSKPVGDLAHSKKILESTLHTSQYICTYFVCTLMFMYMMTNIDALHSLQGLFASVVMIH